MCKGNCAKSAVPLRSICPLPEPYNAMWGPPSSQQLPLSLGCLTPNPGHRSSLSLMLVYSMLRNLSSPTLEEGGLDMIMFCRTSDSSEPNPYF